MWASPRMRRRARSPTSSAVSGGRGPVAAGMVFIALGGAAIGYAVTRKAEGGMAPQATEAMGAAVAQLDGEISVAATAVDARGKSIAENASVRAVVGTDAETAANMANHELA